MSFGDGIREPIDARPTAGVNRHWLNSIPGLGAATTPNEIMGIQTAQV